MVDKLYRISYHKHMKLGITGTQHGMSRPQLSRMIELLMMVKAESEIEEVHHGDCIGVDSEFIAMIRVGFPETYIVCHPPIIFTKRAMVASHITLDPKPYLERNKDIVDAVDLMFAAPRTMKEELRSGTWATIRYARKQNRHTIIVWPDGTNT